MLSIDHSLHILAVAAGLEVRGLESPFGSTFKKLCDLELVIDLSELQGAVNSRTQKSLWRFLPGLGWNNTEMCWEPGPG